MQPFSLPEQFFYLMEHEAETHRLEQKTDFDSLSAQAHWAGLRPGMRVLDVGCGAGITTKMLSKLVGESGSCLGIDASPERIEHARNLYSGPGISFLQANIYAPLDYLPPFDFIWVRFFLEYHQQGAATIVHRLKKCLRPGGILCLIDLDNNCTGHFEMPERLSQALNGVMQQLVDHRDFDPQMGKKLYTYMYDAGMQDIAVSLGAHHLIYGHLQEKEAYNWSRKIEVAAARSGYEFPEYEDGFEGFLRDFKEFFFDPRRFTYTPLLCCRGVAF
ncbi:class I SAM-dependent methyltransferase [Desulfohalobium retbaense]|uniref:Methyltransferase type 11 n=1 Tax=Desulfohalobium retbaense (strain ATCC 49708 / DSM 5692 / JCM 16813 / HR100) TaxID=485915 RepID=C8X1L1_DESRD|nr:class I SAM-dependent methyltransferase [Desulfohalobium retbaense]ACV68308.1 Methyltransferase type 11 [Desulfohalobium retbaense DSM 5692]